MNSINDYHKNDIGIKLTRSEEKFNKLFEYSPVGMALIKHETGEFVEVNQTLLDWTGYTKEEFLKLSFWDITPPEYEDQEQQQMSDLESKGRFGPNEKEYIRKDGSRFPIRLKGFILEDVDGTKLVWGVIENISNEYQRIFEALQDAYMQFDLSYNLIMVNQGTVKMFGYTTKDEMIGKNLGELFADHLILKKIKNDLKMRYSLSNCICECARKDGTSFWISFNAQHIKDNEDKTVSLEGLMRDITEHKQLEENLVIKGKELEKSEERFKLMIESISDTIGITDVNGNVKFRSPNNEKLFGINPDDVVGQNAFDFVHPDDKERLHNEFVRLIEDGVGAKRTGEFKYFRKDGSTIIVELEGKNLLDNKLIDGLFLTFHDITERKVADRKIKEESEKLKALIESTDNLIWVVDPVEFGLMTFNQALSHYFKTGRNLNIKEGMSPKDLLPDEYAAEWRRMYGRVLTQGAYKVEYKTSANNQVLELSFNPVKVENELIGISIMGQIITERKQAEIKLLAANENLNKIMNNSMFGVVTIGKDKKIRWANPSAITMMGLKDSADVVGKKCTEYFCPAHEDSCPILDDGQKVDNSEKKIKRHDGNQMPIIKSVTEIEINGEDLLLETFIDITERKLMENALRESEERFRGIISSMDDIVYTLDTQQRHTGVYGNWVEKSNLTEDFFLGKTSSEIFGSEVGKIHEGPTRKALTGENVAYEWDLCNGNERTYYHTSLSPMYDVTGKISGVVGIGRDITKIKVSENKLRSSAEEYKKAQEMGSVGHWYFNPETNEFWGSSETHRIYGFPEDSKVPFENIVNCLSPKDAEKTVQDLFALVNQGTPFNKEFDIIPKNSSEIRTLWSVAEMKKDQNGEPIVGGVLQDITERKMIRKELMTSLEQNKRILDNLQDAYFQADLSGNFIIVNPRAVSMYGYQSFNEMIGKPAQMLYANSEDRNQLIQKLKESGTLTDYSCRGRKKDGTVFDVSMNVQFVKDDSGNIIGTEGLVRDITDRVRLEEELENEKNNLEISNQKLYDRLNKSVIAISKIGEMRDVYTAGHQKRVQQLACKIAHQMGLSQEAIMNISYGALIHDIGKLYIASDIINKPGKISNLEYQILQTHAEQGYEIVKEIDFPEEIPAMIYQHHERLDGTGYPQGLSGDAIILESRILAVADVVEAMTSHRPYRAALGIDAAIDEIRRFKGTKYDADVVDICVDLFNNGYTFV